MLLRQIDDGADVNVFAPASIALIDQSREQQPFASNTLVAIVPIDSDIATIDELLSDGLTLARCSAGVPCGNATDEWLLSSAQELPRASQESNVRSVLTKVRLGEADGGFVYRSDAMAADAEVRVIDLGSEAPEVTLGVGVYSSGDNAVDIASDQFRRFVLSEEAADVFADLGFDRP